MLTNLQWSHSIPLFIAVRIEIQSVTMALVEIIGQTQTFSRSVKQHIPQISSLHFIKYQSHLKGTLFQYVGEIQEIVMRQHLVIPKRFSVNASIKVHGYE